jgi:hypothetical protein
MSEEDFEFGDKLPFLDDEIHPDRWLRARTEIDHVSLLEEFIKKPITGNVINCPLGTHSDSTPSFNIYRNTNSSHCFGCPGTTKEQYNDNVTLVAKWFSINKVAALQWLEKHFKLPPIAGQAAEPEDEEDETDEEPANPFTVKDLAPAFLALAPTLIETVGDAKYLIKKYFLAEHLENPLLLAQVLGRARLESIRLSGHVTNEGTGRAVK